MTPAATNPEPFKLADTGKEVAHVWECNLPSVLPDLERKHGQLHQVWGDPDSRGQRTVRLYPFKQ